MDSKPITTGLPAPQPIPPSDSGTETQETTPQPPSPEEILAAEKEAYINEAVLKFERQCQEFEQDMKTTGFHPYSDPDGFVYCIILVRVFFLENRVEKLALKLYESDPYPYTYAAYMKNPSPPSTHARPLTLADRHKMAWRGREILALPGSSWVEAAGAFKRVFRDKTGGEWADRLEVAQVQRDEAQGEEREGEEWWRYYPPKTGPRGLVKQLTQAEMVARDERERRWAEQRARDGRWSGKGWADGRSGTVVSVDTGTNTGEDQGYSE